MAKLKRRIRFKNKKVEVKERVQDEIIYEQVSKFWKDKQHTLSYLRKRCAEGNPTTTFLIELRQLRG